MSKKKTQQNPVGCKARVGEKDLPLKKFGLGKTEDCLKKKTKEGGNPREERRGPPPPQEF